MLLWKLDTDCVSECLFFGVSVRLVSLPPEVDVRARFHRLSIKTLPGHNQSVLNFVCSQFSFRINRNKIIFETLSKQSSMQCNCFLTLYEQNIFRILVHLIARSFDFLTFTMQQHNWRESYKYVLMSVVA